MDNKTSRKLNMDELEQVSGGGWNSASQVHPPIESSIGVHNQSDPSQVMFALEQTREFLNGGNAQEQIQNLIDSGAAGGCIQNGTLVPIEVGPAIRGS